MMRYTGVVLVAVTVAITIIVLLYFFYHAVIVHSIENAPTIRAASSSGSTT